MKEDSYVNIDECFSKDWNSITIREKKFMEFKKDSKFMKEDKSRLRKMWRENQEKTFDFDLEYV